ncbi:MAG: ABC transporter substrate-binding protein [Chloroflexota bacterium]|nr:ABC transporter substrate-binding protein [Dehalococcoidia bacterium]MDW8253695.1 ABC transporter substrate-binding protein [Chloroflexota bacterium]
MGRLVAQGMIAVALLLAGCAPSAPASPAGRAPDAASAVDQTLVVATSTLSGPLDPNANLPVNRMYDMFDNVVMLDVRTGDPLPAIATSWRVLNPTTWQLVIRPDLTFHDGTRLTARDVKFTFDRSMDPSLRLALGTRLTTVDRVELVDDLTLNVITKAPDPILLRRLTTMSVVPEHYISRVGNEQFALSPVGSGPFRFKEFVPNDRLVLTGYPDHPFRKPKLRELTIRAIPEASARVNGLLTGEVHLAYFIPIDQYDRIRERGMAAQVTNFGTSLGFWMDTVSGDRPVDSPLADKRVRQAINYAVDKESIAKQIFRGLTQPEAQLAQPVTFGYDPTLKPYPYDPAKARALLAEAGYANGFKLRAETTVAIAEFVPIGLLIQQNLRDIGIDLEFIPMTDQAAWTDKVYGRQPRADLFGIPLQNSPAMDLDFSISWFWSKQPPATRHYNNPEFDRYYEPSRTEMDPEKRRQLLQRASAVLLEDPAWLFLVPSATVRGYDPKKVDLGTLGGDGGIRFDQVSRIG